MKKRRGFVQLAILHLLQEESMHGYQIMKKLEKRSEGLYNASAGTIYPALQELLDKGMIILQEDLDKKVYHLNENGEKRLQEFAEKEEKDFWLEWKERQFWRNSKEADQIKQAIKQWDFELKRTIRLIRSEPERTDQLITFIEETTKRLKKDFS
ncbi:PadR family transcriptional regulator [Niallia endozanthoxylica]|uniref:PadR family transcriptional regulator n=1 Tax=Niallia endozanthoxylica TaxID=2036016 RepID=A0A5J5HGZ0_9BACI|nr:PadR family transcriptional regulator [Niallia endozanthoxylica]KAA9019531.1 PadR family transcriptional regulator [Niallia endozanthoxylica]